MIAIAGGVLALLGLVAGALLVGAPLGLVAAAPGPSLWILFPLLTLIGYFLLVVSDLDPLRGTSTKWVAVPLLAVALLATVGLVAVGAGLVSASGLTGTAPLWYVMVVAGVLGAIGTAAYSRKGESQQAS
jgi:hypothetical protein